MFINLLAIVMVLSSSLASGATEHLPDCEFDGIEVQFYNILTSMTFPTSALILQTAVLTQIPSNSPTVLSIPTKSPSYVPSLNPSTSPTLVPSTSPIATDTQKPSKVPSTTPSLRISGESLQQSRDEYVNRLSSNLDASNTNCDEVKRAIIQKTLAEEAMIASGALYDEIVEMASSYNGNTDVENIKRKAKMAHTKVLHEGATAIAAANLASDFCDQAKTQKMKWLQDDAEQLVQEEANAASESSMEARVGLLEQKVARDEMEELLLLIEFDPTLIELEATIDKDKAALIEHLDAVEAEITQVGDQIKELPDPVHEVATLEKKRDLLAQEKAKIEKALMNEEHFRLSESAFKKDEFYESVAPDYIATPPLEYILRSNQQGANVTVEMNWDCQDEVFRSNEEWFQKFGDMIVREVPRCLMSISSTTTGGCITEDTDLSVLLVVTELVTIWESFDPIRCSQVLGSGESLGELPNLAPSDETSQLSTNNPINIPSTEPSVDIVSDSPSEVPSLAPRDETSQLPTDNPSNVPSTEPSVDLVSDSPSERPGLAPSDKTSQLPTDKPSSIPSTEPSVDLMSDSPSERPSLAPSDQTNERPADNSSNVPSNEPSVKPVHNSPSEISSLTSIKAPSGTDP